MSLSNIEKWRQALLLPGEQDIRHSGLRELAEYYGVGIAEAERLCNSALADSKSEWEAQARQTSAAILDFYDRTQSYLFEHVWWHANDLTGNAINVEIIDYACQQGARTYLDFGSGVGANAILAARSGLTVTLADVSRTMLDFARWRLERRGLQAKYIYLRQQSLPDAHFDFVTAMDVMEHLPRPVGEISQISAALKIGGLLIFNARPGADLQRPMHILPTLYPIRRALRSCGLHADPDPAAHRIRALDCFVVRKTAGSTLTNLGWRIYDNVRYSALAETLSQHIHLPHKSLPGDKTLSH